MQPFRELSLADLLTRVTLFVDFSAACAAIVQDYQLGTITRIEPLLVGHSELNAKITTSQGIFAIKFFNHAKSLAICQLVTDALTLLAHNHVPVPKIVSSPQGFLYKIPQEIGQGYVILTDFFVGQTFNQIRPTLQDKTAIAKYLAKINTLSLNQHPAYDPWLLVHLVEEYKKTGHSLSAEDQSLVEPIAQSFEKIDLQTFSTGLVHYDLHKDNLQKSSDGKLCLFDMETIGNGYPILDLATYIGLTCLDPNILDEENQIIFREVVTSYMSVRPFSPNELHQLNLLIKGIYASNIVAANDLIKNSNDDTQETYKWYALGKSSLQRFSNFNFTLLERTTHA